MIVMYEVVDTKAEVEQEPGNDNGSKSGRDTSNTERLDGEEEDQNSAGDAYNGSVAEVWIDHIQTWPSLALV